MAENFSAENVRNFFSEFLNKYRSEAEQNYIEHRNKLLLLNGLPVRFDLMFDKGMNYGIVLMSKKDGVGSEFSIDSSFQDPMMVVAMANSRKYELGDQKRFLYLFQVMPKSFCKWQVDNFVKEFISMEISRSPTSIRN